MFVSSPLPKRGSRARPVSLCGNWILAFAGMTRYRDLRRITQGGSTREWGEALLARKVVAGFDIANRAGFRPHDDRMRHRTAWKTAHPAQHCAVGDSGSGKHHIA